MVEQQWDGILWHFLLWAIRMRAELYFWPKTFLTDSMPKINREIFQHDLALKNSRITNRRYGIAEITPWYFWLVAIVPHGAVQYSVRLWYGPLYTLSASISTYCPCAAAGTQFSALALRADLFMRRDTDSYYKRNTAEKPLPKLEAQLCHFGKFPACETVVLNDDNHRVAESTDAVNYPTLKSGLICSAAPEPRVKSSLNWASVIQLNGVFMWNAPAPSHTPARIYSTQVIPYQGLGRYFHLSLGYAVQRHSLGVGGQSLGSANNGGVLFWRCKSGGHTCERTRRSDSTDSVWEAGRVFPRNVGHDNHIRPGRSGNYSWGRAAVAPHRHKSHHLKRGDEPRNVITRWRSQVICPSRTVKTRNKTGLRASV